MESTSSPDNGRQSRGLARFWPVHGLPAPGQRQSDEDEAAEQAERAGAEATAEGPGFSAPSVGPGAGSGHGQPAQNVGGRGVPDPDRNLGPNPGVEAQ
jgi:hypothetical protein